MATPLKRVWIPSPNYSSRGGAGVRLIVIHTAEGARTIESLGSYFQGNVQASSLPVPTTRSAPSASTSSAATKRGHRVSSIPLPSPSSHAGSW